VSKPVGVLGVNQDHAERPYRHLRRAEADSLVRFKKARWISPILIQEIQRGFWDGWLGTGNAIPFSRVRNKLLKPEPLHYAIPAAGAHTRMVSVKAINYVPPKEEADPVA